jgi:hypothetical protein
VCVVAVGCRDDVVTKIHDHHNVFGANPSYPQGLFVRVLTEAVILEESPDSYFEIAGTVGLPICPTTCGILSHGVYFAHAYMYMTLLYMAFTCTIYIYPYVHDSAARGKPLRA